MQGGKQLGCHVISMCIKCFYHLCYPLSVSQCLCHGCCVMLVTLCSLPRFLSTIITSAQYLNPGSSYWFISLCLLEPPFVPVFQDHPLLSCLPTQLSTCQAQGPAHHSKACPSPPASSLPQAPDAPASSSSLLFCASFPQSLASPASSLILIPCSARLCHPPVPPLPSTFASWCPHSPRHHLFQSLFQWSPS